MTRILLCILCLILFPQAAFSQGRAYKSEYWEKHWREWPRPRFDYTIDSFAAVEHVVQREYFTAGSRSGGERYRQYARFQYPDQQSIENWGKLIFQLPNYQFLEDIDFRIWDGDILIYEARASSIQAKFLDSLVAHPHSGKLFVFSLEFPNLKPGNIAEVMISATGTPLPYHLGFHQSFPIVESVQRIKILSAYPLQYSASDGVEWQEDRHFENKFYHFNYRNCRALSPERGLSTQAADLAGVWIDWKDQVFQYDREESEEWSQIIDHLFYEGALQDYAVYRNSLDREFGLQQYYGSWIRPVRYFHQRPEFLSRNEAHAEGRWRLSKAYADRWLRVQEKLDWIIQENGEPDINVAINLISESQEIEAYRYIRQMPVYPPVFTEYGLLCSHFERLFKYYRVDYRLVLFYPKRSGLPALDYPSPWPAFARGLAWRSSQDEDWQFIIPGPYLGQSLKPGQIPPDFEEGTALLFSRESHLPERIGLPSANPFQHRMEFRRDIQIRPDRGRLTIRDTMRFEGVMQSILANAYLKGDSAQDMLGFTNYKLLHNALLNSIETHERSDNRALEDTIELNLDLSKAIILRAEPTFDRSFSIPMAYGARWRWRFTGMDSLEISLPDIPYLDQEVFSLKQGLEDDGQGSYLYQLDLEFKKCYLEPEDIVAYYQFLDILKREWQLKLIPPKELL